MSISPFEQQEQRRKELEWIAKAAAAADEATEPPYADAKFGERHVVAKEVYKASSAAGRGVSPHKGRREIDRFNPNASRDCTQWMRTDPRHTPYSWFDTVQAGKVKKMQKPRQPNEDSPVFFPQRKWDMPIADAKKATETKKAGDRRPDESAAAMPEGMGPPLQKFADGQSKPRWDTEHHIMVSRMNHEVRPGEREYFDQPRFKDSEAAPRIRQEYVMHDRQCKWNDEPTEEVGPRRTCFTWVAPVNVGGSKVLQLPSYWRTVRDWRSFSEPGLQMSSSSSRTPREKKKTFLEVLADMPPDEATNFWRDWSQHSRHRVRESPQSELFAGKKAIKKREELLTLEKSTSGSVSRSLEGDATTKSPRRSQRRHVPWNDRWSITHSKDNESYGPNHRELFSSAEMLSGAKFGDPASFLTLRSQNWRGAAAGR